jgi:hypothetical protein
MLVSSPLLPIEKSWFAFYPEMGASAASVLRVPVRSGAIVR